MPLHPEIEEIILVTAEAHNPPVSRRSLQQIRRTAEQLMLLSGESEEVEKVVNHMIESPRGNILVRLYYPYGKKPLPALLFFHSGCFIRGDVNTYDPVCRSLANASQCLVVSVNYALAPENPFPAALEDGFSTLVWISNSFKEIGANGRIAIGGEDAGGNLAAVCAQRARNQKGPKIDVAVLVCPLLDFTFQLASHRKFATGYLLEEESLEWYRTQYLSKEIHVKNPEISPLWANRFDSLPPTLILTAEYDPLCDEGEAYAKKLNDGGTPATLHKYEGMVHGFFQMAGLIEESKRAIEEVGTFLRFHLKGSV